MTDPHALIRRMADELDHCRQLLTDDRTERHPLATEARAALEQTTNTMIEISSDAGHIGPFWWVNASTAPKHLHDWIYAGSHHIVWRPGVCGWGSPFGRKFTFVVIAQ